MFDPAMFRRDVPLRLLTTLKAGGSAETFFQAADVDSLAAAAEHAHRQQAKTTVLGWGSNVLPSDKGVKGVVLLNTSRRIDVHPEGEVVADTGANFQELFLKTVQAGLRGLEFAVGIPGTVGGALVSNAGAYRSNVSEFLTSVEVVADGERGWVSPDYLQFSYRDSILRRVDAPPIVLLRIKLKLPTGNTWESYNEARDYQRQRISKQPPSASAGSFFKNVVDQEFAQTLPTLPDALKKAGVVPAGHLIEQCGLKGVRHGGAMVGSRHANFLLNVGGATATEIRQLAEHVAYCVHDRFGVRLEEEVLYLGDWSAHVSGGSRLG